MLKAMRPPSAPGESCACRPPCARHWRHPGPCSTGDRVQAYTGHKSCGQVGRLPSSFPCCGDSGGFITTVGNHRARTLGEQLLSLAHQTHDSALLLEAHHPCGPPW